MRPMQDCKSAVANVTVLDRRHFQSQQRRNIENILKNNFGFFDREKVLKNFFQFSPVSTT
jgi:hypothetical protein